MGYDRHDTITCKDLQNYEINVTVTGQFMSFSFFLLAHVHTMSFKKYRSTLLIQLTRSWTAAELSNILDYQTEPTPT